MSFDWTEFYNLASELSGRPECEASRRTAISRAYYSAYHKARDLAELDGKVFSRTATEHGDVRRYFSDARDPVKKEIGKNLKRLLNQRMEADYNAVTGEPLEVLDCLIKCQGVLDLLKPFEKRYEHSRRRST